MGPTMKWQVFEDWQLVQLERLGRTDTERLETVLNTMWETFPGLLETVVLGALDGGQLSKEGAAAQLDVSVEDVCARLRQYQASQFDGGFALVETGEGVAARLAECQITVWEIVREYRKLGSVERLKDAFPGLSRHELGAALDYAKHHPAEVQHQIDRYEAVLEQRRALYPSLG